MANCIAHIYREGKQEVHRRAHSAIGAKVSTWNTEVRTRINRYGEVIVYAERDGVALLDWKSGPERSVYEIRKLSPPDATHHKRYEYHIFDVTDKLKVKHIDTVYSLKTARMIIKRDKAFELAIVKSGPHGRY
jgi:hypothetical protein